MAMIPPQRPGPPGGIRARNREEKRQLIMNAGIQVFLQKGVDAATIDDITRIAHTAKGSYYRYFESKVALLEEAIKPISHRIKEIFASTLDELRLKDEDEAKYNAYQKLGAALGTLVITNQELFRLYLQESRGAKTPSRIPIINLSELISTGAIEISNLAEEIGAQKTSLPIVSALIVVGTTEMIAHRFLTNQEIGGDPVAIAAKVVDLILEGIRPRN